MPNSRSSDLTSSETLQLQKLGKISVNDHPSVIRKSIKQSWEERLLTGLDKMYSFSAKSATGFNILCNKKWFATLGKIKFCSASRNIVSKMSTNGSDNVTEK